MNVGGLDTFFTSWHAVLYGGYALLAGWLLAMVGRRRLNAHWSGSVPPGYRWGLAGIAVFVAGGILDMAWHVAFGVETGIDALVSPTHLILLTGGVLMLTSPLRAAQPKRAYGARSPHARSAVVALATTAALAGFFLSYLSVFAYPSAREVFTSVPEGAPGHREAELPVIAGLAGYLVTTLLLVAPLLFLRRRSRLPHGTVTLLVPAVALPAAALTQLTFAVPAVAAVAGAALVDLLLAVRPDLPLAVLAGLVPGFVWTAQLLALDSVGSLHWPAALSAGSVGLSMLLAVALPHLTSPDTANRRTALTPSAAGTGSSPMTPGRLDQPAEAEPLPR